MTPPLTTEQLAAMRAGAEQAARLAEAATAGPWAFEHDTDGDDGGYNWATFPTGIKDVISYSEWEGKASQQMDNAAFIAASRTAVPALAGDVLALLAERERLLAEIVRLRGLLKPFEGVIVHTIGPA